MGPQGEGVLIHTGDLVVLRDVLTGFGHGIDAVLLFHQGVDEAPADGGVVDLGIAGKGCVGFGHHEGGARHGFHTARDHQVGLTGLDLTRGDQDGVHAGTAEAVDGGAGDADRQASEQRGHACDVAVVLTGLIGAAEDDVIDGLPIDGRVAGHQGAQWNGAKVIGADGRERATEAANRRADVVADENVSHSKLRYGQVLHGA